MAQERQKIMAAGFDGFQGKPISVRELLATVRQVLDKSPAGWGSGFSGVPGDQLRGGVVSGYTIHTLTIQIASGVWNAEARIRRVRSNEKLYIAVVDCRKPTSEAAETAALAVAQKWVDRREASSA
jgi:hypothetical protein